MKKRDIVIKKKYDKQNNETLQKVARDKQVKIGCNLGSKSSFDKIFPITKPGLYKF